jgi:hypothetical protein
MINKKIIASPLKINLSFLPHASIPKDREFPLTFVNLIAARDRNLGPQRKGHLRVQLLTVSMTKRYEKLNHIDVHFLLHCCKSNFVGREGLKATRCLLTRETYIIYRQKKAFDFSSQAWQNTFPNCQLLSFLSYSLASLLLTPACPFCPSSPSSPSSAWPARHPQCSCRRTSFGSWGFGKLRWIWFNFPWTLGKEKSGPVKNLEMRP